MKFRTATDGVKAALITMAVNCTLLIPLLWMALHEHPISANAVAMLSVWLLLSVLSIVLLALEHRA